MNTYGGQRIRYNEVVPFMFELGKKDDLGYPAEVPLIRAGMDITVMNLLQDNEGYVYFYDVLFKLLKEKYGNFKYNKNVVVDKLIMTVLENKEKAIKASIQRKIDKIQMSGNKMYGEKNREEFLREEARNMNAFLRIIVMRNIIANWRKYIQKKKQDRLIGVSDSITPQYSLSVSADIGLSRDEYESKRTVPNNDEEARRRSYQLQSGIHSLFVPALSGGAYDIKKSRSFNE